MRFPRILPALIVTMLLVSFLSAKDAPDTGPHTFYGQVVLIDPAKKVIVIQSHKQRLVFHYNEQTRISSTLGEVHMDRVIRGTHAAVVMRLGEGNVGIANRDPFRPLPQLGADPGPDLRQDGARRNHQQGARREICRLQA